MRKTVKLIGITVLFVFLDSESILGLYFEKKCSEIVSFFFWMLDPNTYSLAPLHSSLRNIVVRFCVRNLVLNLFVLLEVFKA